jgi:thiol:disulfide interchange protein DsbD
MLLDVMKTNFGTALRFVSFSMLMTLLARPIGSSQLPTNRLDAGLFGSSGGRQTEFLPVEKAFRVSATATGPEQIRVTFVIAPGYYLYQRRLQFIASSPGVRLGSPVLPRGEPHTDEYFGTQTVYRGILEAMLSVSRPAGSSGAVTVSVGYQGCADAGLCYPPQTAPLTIELPRRSP